MRLYNAKYPLTMMFDLAHAQGDNVALFRLTVAAQSLSHGGVASLAGWLAHVWLAEHAARAR